MGINNNKKNKIKKIKIIKGHPAKKNRIFGNKISFCQNFIVLCLNGWDFLEKKHEKTIF